MEQLQPSRSAPILHPRLKWLRRIALTTALALLVLSGVIYAQMGQIPADLDTSTSKLSQNGLYQVSYRPTEATPPVNQLQSWLLEVETADGDPVAEATITLDGDMPQHGHGLPTAPVVSGQGDSSYLVEGLKFQMGGWWYTEFHIRSPLGDDRVRFDFVLEQ